MTDNTTNAVRVSNLSDTQLVVEILGVNKDKDTVLLQPRATTWLPPGFTPVDPKLRNLYIFPDVTPAPSSEVEVPEKGGNAK